MQWSYSLLTVIALGAVPEFVAIAADSVSVLALVADDECLADGNGAIGAEGKCALQALQRRGLGVSVVVQQAESDQEEEEEDDDDQQDVDDWAAPQFVEDGRTINSTSHDATVGMGDHPYVTGCSAQTGGQACPGMTKCVTNSDDSWSQCVDCSRQGFQKDCTMMNGDMRRAATSACGRVCASTTPAPLLHGCNDDVPGLECPEHLTCVATADGSWSQCVDCSRQFYKDCQKLNHDMRYAAIQKCQKTCMDTKCDDASWCLRPYKCIGSSEWSQCLRCSSKAFRYQCHRWGEDLRNAAEKQCQRKCKAPQR